MRLNRAEAQQGSGRQRWHALVQPPPLRRPLCDRAGVVVVLLPLVEAAELVPLHAHRVLRIVAVAC
jgi:hypothetical protein